VDASPLPAMIVEQNEVNEKLYTALSHLAIKQREVIILRYIEQYSVKETAQILQCTEARIKNDTARGLKRLRELLEGGNVYGKAPSKFS
jgi:RNA polymerase sigma-70 factor, ECF subfamily